MFYRNKFLASIGFALILITGQQCAASRNLDNSTTEARHGNSTKGALELPLKCTEPSGHLLWLEFVYFQANDSASREIIVEAKTSTGLDFILPCKKEVDKSGFESLICDKDLSYTGAVDKRHIELKYVDKGSYEATAKMTNNRGVSEATWPDCKAL